MFCEWRNTWIKICTRYLKNRNSLMKTLLYLKNIACYATLPRLRKASETTANLPFPGSTITCSL